VSPSYCRLCGLVGRKSGRWSSIRVMICGRRLEGLDVERGGFDANELRDFEEVVLFL
jgi:hypothetical protein